MEIFSGVTLSPIIDIFGHFTHSQWTSNIERCTSFYDTGKLHPFGLLFFYFIFSLFFCVFLFNFFLMSNYVLFTINKFSLAFSNCNVLVHCVSCQLIIVSMFARFFRSVRFDNELLGIE